MLRGRSHCFRLIGNRVLEKESSLGSTAINWQSWGLNSGQSTPAFTPVVSTKAKHLCAKAERGSGTGKPNSGAEPRSSSLPAVLSMGETPGMMLITGFVEQIYRWAPPGRRALHEEASVCGGLWQAITRGSAGLQCRRHWGDVWEGWEGEKDLTRKGLARQTQGLALGRGAAENSCIHLFSHFLIQFLFPEYLHPLYTEHYTYKEF